MLFVVRQYHVRVLVVFAVPLEETAFVALPITQVPYCIVQYGESGSDDGRDDVEVAVIAIGDEEVPLTLLTVPEGRGVEHDVRDAIVLRREDVLHEVIQQRATDGIGLLHRFPHYHVESIHRILTELVHIDRLLRPGAVRLFPVAGRDTREAGAPGVAERHLSLEVWPRGFRLVHELDAQRLARLPAESVCLQLARYIEDTFDAHREPAGEDVNPYGSSS